MRMYRIRHPEKDGEDVMGPVGEDNVYINAYGVPLPGQTPVHQLKVGESTLVKYSLSGTTGTYKVIRLEDKE